MKPDNTELLVRLRKLHDELSAMNADSHLAENVDEKTIEALGQLVTDASDLIGNVQTTSANDPATEVHGDLMDRVIQFEREHPRVASFLNQMTDLLAMMGI